MLYRIYFLFAMTKTIITVIGQFCNWELYLTTVVADLLNFTSNLICFIFQIMTITMTIITIIKILIFPCFVGQLQ